MARLQSYRKTDQKSKLQNRLFRCTETSDLFFGQGFSTPRQPGVASYFERSADHSAILSA